MAVAYLFRHLALPENITIGLERPTWVKHVNLFRSIVSYKEKNFVFMAKAGKYFDFVSS
jgi:hypothetical protein